MTEDTGGDFPLERELKLDLVSEHAFRRLLEALSWRGIPVKQVNTFFDTPENALRKKRFALRIRRENGGYLLTLKGRRRGRGELVERLEVECRMSETDARAALEESRSLAAMDYPPVKRLLRELDVSSRELELRPFCSFSNDRYPVRIEGSGAPLFLEIDRTEFKADRVGYELEVEFPFLDRYPRQREFLKRMLRELSIPWIVSGKSKFQKALEHL